MTDPARSAARTRLRAIKRDVGQYRDFFSDADGDELQRAIECIANAIVELVELVEGDTE